LSSSARFIGLTGTTTALARRMAKVRDHQLRAVLHVHHHAVTLLHAQRRQARRQPLGLVQERGIAEDPAEEHDGGLVAGSAAH
jgi:hypothetical protein